MEKKTVKITETYLKNIIKESVNQVVKENFGDRAKGAVQGYRQGAAQMRDNDASHKTYSNEVRHNISMAIDMLRNCEQTGAQPRVVKEVIGLLTATYNSVNTHNGAYDYDDTIR